MRGLADWNLPAFDAAERAWRTAGHHPFSPAALVRALGYEVGHACQPREGKSAIDHLRHVMLSDIACIYASEAIALLPGWETSKGATVELALAQFLGLPVYDACTHQILLPLPTPWLWPEL